MIEELDQAIMAAEGVADELLPEEVEAQERAAEEKLLEHLEAFGRAIAGKRDEAIAGRVSSGIEEIWTEDEEAYQGIDDANRGDKSTAPTTHTGGSSIIGKQKDTTRSTVFMNITRPYVDAASAKVSDMLLPTDDRNWGLGPSPIPDLVKRKNDQTGVTDPFGQPVMQQMVGPDGQPMQKQVTVADQVAAAFAQAKESAEAAEKRIDDWLMECQYHAEVRKVIEDCSRLGTGVLKGPFPSRHRKKAVSRTMDGLTEVQLVEMIAPKSKRIDPWNLYPDPACGECIHNGSYLFERDTITAKQLRDLMGVPGYISSQIHEVLEEGPGKKFANGVKNEKVSDKDKYEIWYYHGAIEAEDAKVAGIDIEEGDSVNALVVQVNDRVIKAALNPLDSGEFPYDVMPWQRRTDSPFGVGVSRQVRTPQRMLNAAARNMMDNAGLSAGPQIILRRSLIEPADGSWQLVPRKMWFVNDDGDTRSVADAMTAININSMQAELMGIIQFAQKMAEDVTGLPMLLQGQQGAAPETVGGMTMLSNNASAVLRRIARTFDDFITEPHIRRYYEWLLMYGEDDNEKGDFMVDARGSTALVERDMQNQLIAQMGQIVMNPVFGIDPELWIAEYLKTQRVDPKRLQYTEEKKKALQEAAAQQPPDPNQMRAEAVVKVAELRSQSDLQRAQMQGQSDMQELEFKKQIAEADHAARMRELEVQERIEMMKLATQQRVSLEKIKGQLSDTSLRERNKRDLAGEEMRLKAQMGTGI